MKNDVSPYILCSNIRIYTKINALKAYIMSIPLRECEGWTLTNCPHSFLRSFAVAKFALSRNAFRKIEQFLIQNFK